MATIRPRQQRPRRAERERWRADLWTPVKSLSYEFDTRTGVLVMPEGCCTDMSGAIALFRGIDAEVTRIETYGGAVRDTTYARGPRGKWDARLPATPTHRPDYRD
jgi:hypothetical protein